MVSPLRQLQEKCRVQQTPLYIAFIDLTKAFDLVSRHRLFKILSKIGCPPKLQSMIESFHTDTKETVQFNGSSSEPTEIRGGVKQGCVLAPTLVVIFFGMFLKHAFDTTTEGIYLRTRSDGKLFNLARLRAKTKVRKVLIRDMLFADDAAVVTHTQEELQSLMDCFSQASKDFGLTISRKKTNDLGQDTEAPPVITIDDYELIPVWQRDMDYVCRAGEKAQLIPPEKHPPYPGNILAGQSNKLWCHVSCWSSHYVHPAQTTQTAMVGSCPP